MRKIIDDLRMENFTMKEILVYGVLYPSAFFGVLVLSSLADALF